MNDIATIRRQLGAFSFNDYLRHLKTVEETSQELKPLRVAVRSMMSLLFHEPPRTLL